MQQGYWPQQSPEKEQGKDGDFFTIATDFELSINHNSHLKAGRAIHCTSLVPRSLFPPLTWLGYKVIIVQDGFQSKGDREMGTRQLALSG